MVDGTFRLPPGTAAALIAAVEATVMRTSAPPIVTSSATISVDHATAVASSHPSLAQQRADALIELVTNGGASIETEIVLHVRGDGCTFDDGTPVTDTIVERLASTAFLRALVHDADGRPINASSRRRHPSVRQKRVVKERDRCCVDCGSTDLLEYDHNPSHHHTGHTITDELELRCAPCHHRRHAHENRGQA
jgi:5-methylcytosine-specific restriction endonuclease McrA